MATTTVSSPSPQPPTLSTLPTEIQQSILSHLNIPTLLTFALTSHHNYHLTRSVLTTLHLAVFSKRVHGVLSFLNYLDTTRLTSPSLDFLHDQAELNCLNQPITLPPHPSSLPPPTSSPPHHHHHRHLHRRSPRPHQPTITPQAHRSHQIHHQNASTSTILSTPLLSHLTTLTLHTYALLSPSLANTLSTALPFLKHLTLNFSHPAIHDPCLPAFYWETAPPFDKEGCTAWNLLAGVGKGNDAGLRLRGLRTLSVVRAAVTGRQCWEWVGRNEGLEGLRLELVTGVEWEGFCGGLAGLWGGGDDEGKKRRRRAPLRRLELLRCPNLVLRTRGDFEWVDVMVRRAGLRWLDLRGCAGVDMDVLRGCCEEKGWEEMGLVLAEDVDEQAETRSMDPEVEHATDMLRKGKGPVIEIDPNFD